MYVCVCVCVAEVNRAGFEVQRAMEIESKVAERVSRFNVSHSFDSISDSYRAMLAFVPTFYSDFAIPPVPRTENFTICGPTGPCFAFNAEIIVTFPLYEFQKRFSRDTICTSNQKTQSSYKSLCTI